jgi:hypothetical protein
VFLLLLPAVLVGVAAEGGRGGERRALYGEKIGDLNPMQALYGPYTHSPIKPIRNRHWQSHKAGTTKRCPNRPG